MERLTYKTNGKYANTTAEQAPPYAIDCDIDTAITKLAEYEDLEEHGKLLRLPVAVGDIIWDIDFGRPCGYEVTGFSFGSLNDDDWEEEKVLDKVVVYYTNSNGSITGNFAISEIGKNVFLTKEEAEAALKELERGKEMSNDLISRSALMQSLRNNVLVDVTPNLEQAIAEQPTADYVDKVIEQLEENAKYFQSEADELAQVGNWGTATELQGKAAAYRDAAKTVKSGGIE